VAVRLRVWGLSEPRLVTPLGGVLLGLRYPDLGGFGDRIYVPPGPEPYCKPSIPPRVSLSLQLFRWYT
jgi:hypothetical protein